jgi:hypothetical protein
VNTLPCIAIDEVVQSGSKLLQYKSGLGSSYFRIHSDRGKSNTYSAARYWLPYWGTERHCFEP